MPRSNNCGRLLAVTTWAAGVAIFWAAIMAPDAGRRVQLALLLAPVSGLLWCAITLHLMRHRYRRPLLAAVCWGAASPLLGGILIAALTALYSHFWGWRLGGDACAKILLMGLLFLIATPQTFFPVGILVGATAWLLTKGAVNAATTHATHPSPSRRR